MRGLIFLFFVFLSSACKSDVDGIKQVEKNGFIKPEGLYSTNAYTQVVETQGGKTIYISGQVPLDENGALVGNGSFDSQIRQVFKNIDIALKSASATFDDVIKVTYYIKNYKPEYLLIVREMRSQYFNEENPPTASLVGVQSLFLDDVLVEVEVVAHIN